jgi:hypothetical protein
MVYSINPLLGFIYFIISYCGIIFLIKKRIKSNPSLLEYSIILPIILYFLFISYSFIVFEKINHIVKTVNFIFFLFGLIFITINIKKIKFNYKINFTNIILFLFFLSSFSPVSDMDSLRYYLETAKKLYNQTLYEKITYDYFYFGSNEFINYWGLTYSLENIGSLVNFTSLILIYNSNNYLKKKYNIGYGNLSTLLIISVPFLISSNNSQKIYIFQSYLIIYSFLTLYLKEKITINENIILISINSFVLVSKFSFLPFIIFNFIFILLKSDNQKKTLLNFLLIFIILFIFLLPRIYILNKVFNQPFLPFILYNNYNQELITFKNYLLSYDRPLNLINLILTPINLIIPLKTEDIFKVFGITGALIYFFPFKNNKIIGSFILFNLFAIILIGNLQLRWFFPIIILAALFAKKMLIDNIYFRKIIYIQAIFAIITLSLFSSISIASLFSNKFKEKFFNYFVSELKVLENLNNKILISDIQYNYYINDYIPLYDLEFEKSDLNSYIIRKTKNNSSDTKYILITKNTNYNNLILGSELFNIENFYQKKHKINNRNLLNYNFINYYYILFSIKKNN